jgi:hypothetical protein
MSLYRFLCLSNCTKGVSKIGGGLPLFTNCRELVFSETDRHIEGMGFFRATKTDSGFGRSGFSILL